MMGKLLCRLGWHSARCVEVVISYACYRCRRCGHGWTEELWR